jgi:hypothetical protein
MNKEIVETPEITIVEPKKYIKVKESKNFLMIIRQLKKIQLIFGIVFLAIKLGKKESLVY